MKWFIRLKRKIRDIITVAAWIAVIVLSAVYSQIENAVIAVVTTAFLIAAIVFTTFAVKTNKSDKEKREKDISSQSKENTETVTQIETEILNEKTEQPESEHFPKENIHAGQSNPETVSIKTVNLNDINEVRKLDVHTLLKLLEEEEAAKKATEEKSKPKKIKSDNAHPKISIKDIQNAVTEFISDPLFEGKNFVFTGQLKNMEREEAYAAVISRGGTIKANISQKVNYLVNADPEAAAKKLKDARFLQEQGIPIKIISDEEFMEMLGKASQSGNLNEPIDYETLTVIDFEVANEQFASACAIGIALIKNGEIVDRQYHLIKPPDNRYLQSTIDVHGITPEQTENAETFPQVWSKIQHLFHNRVVAAHNAVFDVAVLKAALKHYGIPQPKLMYCCSIEISSLCIPYDTPVRKALEARCGYFDIPLPLHHHALCDAEACANIIIASFQKLADTDFSEFIKTGVRLKDFTEVKNSAVIGFVQRAQKEDPATPRSNVS